MKILILKPSRVRLKEEAAMTYKVIVLIGIIGLLSTPKTTGSLSAQGQAQNTDLKTAPERLYAYGNENKDLIARDKTDQKQVLEQNYGDDDDPDENTDQDDSDDC